MLTVLRSAFADEFAFRKLIYLQIRIARLTAFAGLGRS